MPDLFRRVAIALVLFSTVAHAQGRAGAESEEEQAFQAAEDAFRHNRDDEAARLYDRVIAINPGRPDPWIKRAVILYKQKKYSDAVNLLRRAQQVLPDDPGIKGQLGLSLYRAGAPEMAVQMMEEVVATRPDSYQLQLQLGQHYVRVGEGKKAVAALEAYFKHRPVEAAGQDIQIRPLLGTAYLENRQYGEAEREFTTVLRVQPNDVSARVHLGEVFTARGDWSKAIAIYEKLLGEAPRQPAIFYNLGTCYLKVNRPADAQRCAQQYTQLRAKEGKGFVLLGDAKLEAHDLAGALAAYDAAGRLDPAHPPSARLGKVYLAQKNYPAAMRVLEEAAAARPDALDIQQQLAEAYVATRASRDKLTAVGERLAKSTDAEDLTVAGVAFFAAGEDGRAERLFAQALEVDPRDRRARNGLLLTLQRAAQSALQKGNLPQAEGALLRAEKLDSESLQGNRNLGLVLLLEKRYADAERYLRACLRKVPRDVAVNRLLGRALAGEKRRDEAIKAYEIALQTAQRTRGTPLVEVGSELGALYVDAGHFDQAVALLDAAAREPGVPAASIAAAQRNLAVALYHRGLERLKDPKLGEAAFDDLTRAAQSPKGTLAPREAGALDCALGLAALRAGRALVAQESFTRAQREGGCVTRAPYDRFGVDFLVAYSEYRDTQNPLKREAAAKAFQKMLPKASGPLNQLLRDLMRSSYELEGYDFYLRGDDARAALALKSANALARGGRDRRTLDNNLAVLDLLGGRTAAASRAFEELGQRPPEALANLGIIMDRQGDGRRALDLYKKAAERGARAPKLREWIDVKERLFGGAK